MNRNTLYFFIITLFIFTIYLLYVDYSGLDGISFGPKTSTKCSQVSQYGVTFSFSSNVPCGRFVNGDWWVVGPVTINSINPPFLNGRNGYQINPTQFLQQGYDSRVTGYDSGLVPSLPVTISTPSSLIKVISNDASAVCENSPAQTCHIDTAVVLTVLTSAPISPSFRPGFAGIHKIIYPYNNLRTSLVPSLAPPVGVSAPSLSFAETRYQRIQLDYPGWQFGSLRPDKNMQSYGGDIGRDAGDVALRLLLNDPISSKMPAIINYVQAGIDYASLVGNGADYSTAGGGGHENGRLAQILFAAFLLNDAGLSNLVSSSGNSFFGENNIAGLDLTMNIPLAAQEINYCGESTYWRVLHNTDPGGKTCQDPYLKIDGGIYPINGYQQTFSNAAMGSVLAILLLDPSQGIWNNQLTVDYLDRWANSGAWTQPDSCAPAPGVCVGGSSPNSLCSSAVAVYNPSTGVNFPCPGGGICSLVTPVVNNVPSNPNYGVTYGPNGNGGCILDTNPSDGIGRFPNLHMVGHGNGYGSNFANAMWNNYFVSTDGN